MTPDDQSINALLDEFKKGGWIMAVLGGLGMLARLILTNEKYSFFVWLRKIIAGGIIGVLAYFAMYGMDVAEIYKSVISAICGSIAPELFEAVRKRVLERLSK
jgi:hypothetical protein